MESSHLQGIHDKNSRTRSLSWNKHFQRIGTAFPEMFSTGKFVDVTLACEGRRIHCHRVVLAASSDYFSDLLEENPTQHPIIILPKDMKFCTMNTLVEFMYKGEISITERDFEELLIWAEVLKIHGLNKVTSLNQEDCNETLLDVFKVEISDEEFDETVEFQQNQDSFDHASSSKMCQRKSPQKSSTSTSTNNDQESHIPIDPESEESMDFNQEIGFNQQQSLPLIHEPSSFSRRRCKKSLEPIFESPPREFFLMPSKAPRSYDAKAMWSALMSVKKGLSLHKAAKIYNIPNKTLRNHMKRQGINSCIPQPPHLTKYQQLSKYSKK